jgi:hypothetical protein
MVDLPGLGASGDHSGWQRLLEVFELQPLDLAVERREVDAEVSAALALSPPTLVRCA